MLGPVDAYKMSNALNCLICDFFQRTHRNNSPSLGAHSIGKDEDAEDACLCLSYAMSVNSISEAELTEVPLVDNERAVAGAGSEAGYVRLAASTVATTASSSGDKGNISSSISSTSKQACMEPKQSGKVISPDPEYARLSRYISDADVLGDMLLDVLCVAEVPGGKEVQGV